jgi:lysophospholipase L1-like esterase
MQAADKPTAAPAPDVPARAAVAAAYLVQVLVPAALLLDIGTAWLRGKIGSRPTGLNALLAGFSGLWLVAGLGFFYLNRNRQEFLRKGLAPLASIYITLLLVGLMELGTRLIGIAPPIPGAQPPRTRAVNQIDPALYPGVSGAKRFTINRLGLRGPMPPARGSSYRILAVGGSTTECAALDDSEEWAHVLMEDLNSSEKRVPVWVGNSGVGGKNAVHHLVLMQWLPGILPVDMVVFLFGVNDMTAALAFEGGPSQAAIEKAAGFEGNLPAGVHWRSADPYPLYRRLKLFLLVREAGGAFKARFRRPASMPVMFNLAEVRKLRATSPVLPLPDLSTGLAEYRGRILALANRCGDLHIRCLFLTQPTMWRDNLTTDEESLFWLGYLGPWLHPKGYISSADLARAMDLYNRTLLDVCRQSSLECFDLAARIPKTTAAFFDEMHFNEAGSRLVARNLNEYLLSRPPFGSAAP